MKKGESLIGNKSTYTILKDFEVTGGMSKVTDVISEKDGKVYFIKEFLSPKYPVNKGMSGSSSTIERRKKRCADFENHHTKINKEIAKKSSIGGNLISAYDFFRSGTTYFKVCEKVDVSSLSIIEISKLPVQNKLLIIRTIVGSLKILHDLQIVHGDLKPDNILIKSISEKKYVAKLIDFDNSYFSSNPPANSEDVIGTQEYYSPEMAKYIIGSDGIDAKDLTTKSDVYALGILFCEYWSGKKPKTKSKYKYSWQQTIDSEIVELNSKIPSELERLIKDMMCLDPKKRPSLSEVISYFRERPDESNWEITEHEVDLSLFPDEITKGFLKKTKLIKKIEEEKKETRPKSATSTHSESKTDESAEDKKNKLKGKLIK